MREFVLYRGEKFWIQSSGRYFQSGNKNAPERLLHRRIWVDNFGPIPEGLEIHHRDEDWRNNDLTNFALLLRETHRREHQTKRMADPVFRAKAIKALRDSSDKAAAWHASPEGLAWHAVNGKQAWAKREAVPAVCTICSKPYETYFESRSRFCSHACELKEGYQRHRTATGDCVQCGTAFTFNKYKKPAQECCSRTCAIRRRHGHPPKEASA